MKSINIVITRDEEGLFKGRVYLNNKVIEYFSSTIPITLYKKLFNYFIEQVTAQENIKINLKFNREKKHDRKPNIPN